MGDYANKNVEKVMAWQKANAAKRKAYMRDYNLKRTFGITLEEYGVMIEAQGGVCACCRNPNYDKPLAVDHCHASGKIRGLLCHSCNNHLGIYEKMKEAFEAYLVKYG